MLSSRNDYKETQKVLFHLYVYLIIHDLLSSAFKIRVLANLNGMSHSVSNDINRNQNSKFSQHSCTYIHHKNEIISKYDSPGYLDTISQNDIVQQQYLSLPYPAVSQGDILNEQMHYSSSKRNTPFDVFDAITLETINHFLYKGSSNFRYVECLNRYIMLIKRHNIVYYF